MCLIVDKERTIKERTLGAASYTFYKVFVPKRVCSWGPGKLMTPYFKFMVESWGRVEMQGADWYEGQQFIYRAFHARTSAEATKPDAFHAEFFDMGKPVCVPIHVERSDLIAFGMDDKVSFSAYTITEGDWKAAWA